MPKKAKTIFVCQECGYESPKWMGQCICGAWNSFVDEKVPDISVGDSRRRTGSAGNNGRAAAPSRLNSVGAGAYERIDTGITELNRVLGGGLVKGSLVLISGEPGIGKSTVIIQAAANIAAKNGTVLYVSGEESEAQIKLRADRVCTVMSDDLLVLSETNMENVESVCETLKPSFLIIDSIQTMYSQELDSSPGSVSQVRACGNMLMKIGKSLGIPVFIVAHVTKSGDLAGPKTVEHLVDCVLGFHGERDRDLRILRAYKNRFGTTSEIGAFRMGEKGLEEIHDLAGTFLDNKGQMPEGAVISATYEGSRPLFMEIQALTSPANVGFARRTAVGIDNTRLSMIIAVLEKKAGLNLMNQDVYVNVVGGIRPDSTSVDLAVALAIYSSLRGIKSSKRMMAIGEVGLTGEIRSVGGIEKIVSEANRMGYEQMIIPQKNASPLGNASGKCRITGASNIFEAIDLFRD